MILGPPAEVAEIFVGKLIDFEKRAELHMMDLLLGEDAEEPIERIAIFDRIGFNADFQLQSTRGQKITEELESIKINQIQST